MKTVYYTLGVLALLVGAAVRVFIKDNYWVYIPAIIDYVKYPVLPNQPVVWRPGGNTRGEGGAVSDTDKTKPNVIVILVDDLGFNDITFFGGGYHNGDLRTPNIDSIGKAGISFRNGYAGHATCAPSRAALLTGQFPTKIGYEYTPVSDAGAKVLGKYMNFNDLPGIFHADRAKGFSWANMSLSRNATTIAEALQGSGYKTIQIGKYHNGFTEDSHAISRGFDETLGFSLISRYLPRMSPDAEDCVLPDVFDKFIWANSPYAIKKDREPYFAPKGYLTDYLADEAVNAIKANKNDPFFMFLAFTAVHTPLSALKSDYATLSHIPKHCDRVYAAVVLALDRAVGKVLSSLKELGISENTMVIFTSDNGGAGYIGQRHINEPYRGWKASFFEGGVHVPFFIQWDGVIQPGQTRDEPISQIDIFPTVLSAAGVSYYPGPLDGVNLMPYLTNPDMHPANGNIHDILFWRSGHYMAARVGDWKIQTSENPQKIWLYNLKEDPTEKTNLAKSNDHQTIVQELLTILKAENEKQMAPQWPSLSESPVVIDKIFGDTYVEGDDYVYWPN
jgi:arylsulfatase A-like enzyme